MIIQKCSIWKVAQVFFIEPTKTHYIKEISRKIKLAHTSVKKHVTDLLKEGLIENDSRGVFKGYKSARENPDFIFAKKISNIIQLRESGLLDALKDKYPKSIILFGSYDKGEDIESSDIDIFVSSKKFKIDKEKFEKYLNRNIHILFEDEVNSSLMGSIKQGNLIFGER